MRRVLMAERDANQAIVDCESRAEKILGDARECARHIAERADTRISRMQKHSAIAVSEYINAILSEDVEQAKQTTALKIGDEELQQAVDTLAAQLSGAENTTTQSI